MKDTPARVAQTSLLTVSLIFASAFAPPAVARGAVTQLTTQAELDALSRNGPAIPTDFGGDELRFRGLFKWDWAVNVVYELARPGTVTLSVSVDGHNHPITLTTPPQIKDGTHALSAVMNHACTIPLPGGIGGATYSIKAVTDKPAAPGEPSLIIRAIAAGPPGEPAALDYRLLSPPGDFARLRGARLTEAAYGAAPQTYLTAVPLGLGALSFTPRNIPVVGGKPSENAAYSFRVTLPFNSALVQVKQWRGGRWAEVSQQSFGPGLEAGRTINGTWDCMNGGAPSLGQHRLWVTAWRTIDRRGKWSLVTSEPVAVQPS